MTPDPADLIAAHVAAARRRTAACATCGRTLAGDPDAVLYCSGRCYVNRPRTSQARFDADGLPRGLMPIAGIRCGEWL